MNELGLPRHGAEPSFGADEAAYRDVVRAAARRRRSRVTGTSASVAAVVVTVVVTAGGGPSRGAILEPAETPPAPTATAPARTGLTTLPPALPSGYPTILPTDLPPLPSPAPPASARPTPATTPGPAPARPVWDESVTVVADRPDAECDLAGAGEGWCFRYLGPGSLRSGAGATFETELCRRAGRAASRVDFGKDVEVFVSLAHPDRDGDGYADAHVHNAQRLSDRPHSRTLEIGTCLRWSTRWNGVADTGPALPPGRYYLLVSVLGTTPREPIPGDPNPDEDRSYFHSDPGFVVR